MTPPTALQVSRVIDVLKLLRSAELSQAQIRDAMALAPHTVALWVGEMEEQGLLASRVLHAFDTTGRPPTVYRLSAEWGGPKCIS